MAALLSLPLAACSEASGRGAAPVVIDTLAGGVVQVTNPEHGTWEGGPPWKAVETFRVGSVDAEGPELFAFPADFEVDALGRVYVLEAEAKEVRVFDASGRHVRSFGRDGGGPGEFRQPIAMTWGPRQELWVVDPGNARYSVFDTAGTLLRTHFRHNNAAIMPWPGMVDSGERVYDVTFDVREGGGNTLLRYDRGSDKAESFALPQRQADEFRLERRGGVSTFPVPFAPKNHWALTPDGRVWSGFADQYRLELKDVGGRTLRIAEKPFEPVAVSGAERDSVVPARLQGFTQQGGRIDMSRIPKNKPAFTSLQVDDRGYVWVEPTLPAHGPKVAYDVFDPEGRYVGRVALPESVSQLWNPVFRGDWIFGAVVDEMDVPSVVGFRIEGRRAR